MLMPHDKNVSRASEFGKIQLLFDRSESRPSIWDMALYDEAIDRLAEEHYNPDQDYILVAGTMVPTVLFVAQLVAAHKKVKLLCFDMPSGEYVCKVAGDIAHETRSPRTVQAR
jgi:hypothetical protein